MKLLGFQSVHFVFGCCMVVIQLLDFVKAFSLSQSYGNFANGNQMVSRNFANFNGNQMLSRNFANGNPISNDGNVFNGNQVTNGNSESAESSYESGESNELQEEWPPEISPSKSIPSHSTFFVTATRYEVPEQERSADLNLGPHSTTEFPHQPIQSPQVDQPELSPEDVQVDTMENYRYGEPHTESPLPLNNSEPEDEVMEESVLKESIAESNPEPTPTMLTNTLEDDEEKTTTSAAQQEVTGEQMNAELVEEPIPTPSALISSDGEGSNPPLEEEFAEAFKKVGPNGRRRRIRPGSGRGRRVRMRVRKNRINEHYEQDAEQSVDDNAENSPTIRPRRFRSTTPAPNQSSAPVISQALESSVHVIKNGPKPLIISDIHSHGSTGINSVQQLQSPQMEKPSSGGFTEKASAYFFTPPPGQARISTTIPPKIFNNNSVERSTEVSKGLESQLQSSSAFAIKSHPWDTHTTEDSLNEVETSPTEATKNEPEKSESSVRRLVQKSPMMEDRAYSIHSEDHQHPTIHENFEIGRHSFGSPPSLQNDEQIADKFRNNDGFEYSRNGGESPENHESMQNPFFSSTPFNNQFENNPFPPPPSPPTRRKNKRMRSHYNRNKDPFFNNPMPPEGIQSLDSGINNSNNNNNNNNEQFHSSHFGDNGYSSTLSPISEQFYSPTNGEDQQMHMDYGKSTHYIPTDFRSSPVDPIGKGPPRGSFAENSPSGVNYDNPSDSSSTGLTEPQIFNEQQEQFPGLNQLNHGIEFSGQFPQNNFQNEIPGYPENMNSPVALPMQQFPSASHENNNNNNGISDNGLEFSPNNTTEQSVQDSFGSPIPNYTEPFHTSQQSNPVFDPVSHNISPMNEPHHPNGMQRFPAFVPLSSTEHDMNPRFPDSRPPIRPPMMHRPPFFRNRIPPPMNFPSHGQRHPQPNTPLYSFASPNDFGNPYPGRPPPNFLNSSPHVNLPMPGLNNIPPPPSEQQALSEVQPHHHFPPHTHSISDKPDYEPANPPLPPGQGSPMEANFPSYASEVNNHIDEDHFHNFQEHSPSPPQPQYKPVVTHLVEEHEHHHTVRGNQDHTGPGFDILSAYYDKPPPTIGSEYENNEILPSGQNSDTPKVPYQYSSSDGGGLDNGLFLHNSNSGNSQDSLKDSEFNDNDSEKTNSGANDEKNITAMYSDTPYVLMFPQLVPEEAMIPPPPKILTKEIPVVQASSLSPMQFTPEGKPVLGPGLKAVAVHPRHQMYQVLAKAHYDKALQRYIETRRKPPSTIYTPYGILVPMGPSTAASSNHEKYTKLESHSEGHPRSHTLSQSQSQNHPKDPHERQLLHLLLGKKSPLGNFHLFKHASIKNGRLKQQFDFKANVDPALELLAEKLALKLSAAKYLLSTPAKMGVKAFTKHTASYSEHKPIVLQPPQNSQEDGRTFSSLGLGNELNKLFSDSQHNSYDNKKAKGEVVDPLIKSELKRLLKDRLKEVLEEAEASEMEKNQLAEMASSIMNTKVAFSKAESTKGDKWSSYFNQPNVGLFGTIKRLFWGNPSTNEEKTGAEDEHPFGGGSNSLSNYINSVGRMGLPSATSNGLSYSEVSDSVDKKKAGNAQQRMKKQLEKWLEMVLKPSDMATSESSVKPVYVKYPGPISTSGRFGKSTGTYSDSIGLGQPLPSLSLSHNIGLAQKLGKSVVPSNFLSSSWKPIVTSAFRSVFNYPSDKSTSSSSLAAMYTSNAA